MIISTHSRITVGTSLKSSRVSSCPKLWKESEQLQKTSAKPRKRKRRKQILRAPCPSQPQELACASARAFLRWRMLRPANLLIVLTRPRVETSDSESTSESAPESSAERRASKARP